ncbi:MAG: M48 family metallopeptidase [Candidatus Babeliales bacterium]
MNKATILSLFFILVIGITYLSTLPPIKRYLVTYAQKSMEEAYGSVPLSPVHEVKVQAIAKELGVIESIVMRKMNTNALKAFGYYNAIAASHVFLGILPLVDTPFLFVSEGFFEDLSEREQRFLIGHELIHIKERHTKYIQLVMVLVSLALCILWWLYARKRTEAVIAIYIPESYRLLTLFCAGFISICMLEVIPDLMQLWYRRHIEWRADHQSLALLNSHDGGVQLMERWMKEFKIPQINPYWGLLSDHPSCHERRAYCLAQKHSIIKEVL